MFVCFLKCQSLVIRILVYREGMIWNPGCLHMTSKHGSRESRVSKLNGTTEQARRDQHRKGQVKETEGVTHSVCFVILIRK